MDNFLNCVVSNTAVAGVLALAAFGLQRFWRNPQLAHALWFLVLIKLVTPPVFYVVLPDRLVLSASRAAAPRSSGDTGSLQPSAETKRVVALTPFPLGLAHDDREPIQAAVDSRAGSAEMTAMSASPAPPGAFAVSNLAPLLAARWQDWLCAVWAGGVLLRLAILWRRLSRARTLLMEAIDADADLVDDVRVFAKRLGMRSCPSIRVLDAHVPPLVCAGWRDLFLLVPARLLKELDREQLHAVLVHELAHIRRRDHLMRWFEIFVREIFWWNPLAWWASRQLRQAEEECCDAWVVWALPEGQRSYGEALLWTIEFLAERRAVPVVAGTAFGGSHVKRRIEMVMNRKLNRKMSWGALLVVVLSAVCVLPVAAQKRSDTAVGDRALAEGEPKPEAVTQAPKAAAESRDLEARIERLERLLQELSQTVKSSAANVGSDGRDKRGITSRHYAVSESLARENRLRETLLALDKQAWDAASSRDWKAYEKLLRPGYYWGYFGTSRNGPNVAALQRRRYFDVNIREVEVGKITEDVAFLKYVYNCKVEEGGQVQTYRDHQSIQIWKQNDGDWFLTYTTNFILAGGE